MYSSFLSLSLSLTHPPSLPPFRGSPFLLALVPCSASPFAPSLHFISFHSPPPTCIAFLLLLLSLSLSLGQCPPPRPKHIRHFIFLFYFLINSFSCPDSVACCALSFFRALFYSSFFFFFVSLSFALLAFSAPRLHFSCIQIRTAHRNGTSNGDSTPLSPPLPNQT